MTQVSLSVEDACALIASYTRLDECSDSLVRADVWMAARRGLQEASITLKHGRVAVNALGRTLQELAAGELGAQRISDLAAFFRAAAEFTAHVGAPAAAGGGTTASASSALSSAGAFFVLPRALQTEKEELADLWPSSFCSDLGDSSAPSHGVLRTEGAVRLATAALLLLETDLGGLGERAPVDTSSASSPCSAALLSATTVATLAHCLRRQGNTKKIFLLLLGGGGSAGPVSVLEALCRARSTCTHSLASLPSSPPSDLSRQLTSLAAQIEELLESSLLRPSEIALGYAGALPAAWSLVQRSAIAYDVAAPSSTTGGATVGSRAVAVRARLTRPAVLGAERRLFEHLRALSTIRVSVDGGGSVGAAERGCAVAAAAAALPRGGCAAIECLPFLLASFVRCFRSARDKAVQVDLSTHSSSAAAAGEGGPAATAGSKKRARSGPTERPSEAGAAAAWVASSALASLRQAPEFGFLAECIALVLGVPALLPASEAPAAHPSTLEAAPGASGKSKSMPPPVSAGEDAVALDAAAANPLSVLPPASSLPLDVEGSIVKLAALGALLEVALSENLYAIHEDAAPHPQGAILFLAARWTVWALEEGLPRASGAAATGRLLRAATGVLAPLLKLNHSLVQPLLPGVLAVSVLRSAAAPEVQVTCSAFCTELVALYSRLRQLGVVLELYSRLQAAAGAGAAGPASSSPSAAASRFGAVMMHAPHLSALSEAFTALPPGQVGDIGDVLVRGVAASVASVRAAIDAGRTVSARSAGPGTTPSAAATTPSEGKKKGKKGAAPTPAGVIGSPPSQQQSLRGDPEARAEGVTQAVALLAPFAALLTRFLRSLTVSSATAVRLAHLAVWVAEGIVSPLFLQAARALSLPRAAQGAGDDPAVTLASTAAMLQCAVTDIALCISNYDSIFSRPGALVAHGSGSPLQSLWPVPRLRPAVEAALLLAGGASTASSLTSQPLPAPSPCALPQDEYAAAFGGAAHWQEGAPATAAAAASSGGDSRLQLASALKSAYVQGLPASPAPPAQSPAPGAETPHLVPLSLLQLVQAALQRDQAAPQGSGAGEALLQGGSGALHLYSAAESRLRLLHAYLGAARASPGPVTPGDASAGARTAAEVDAAAAAAEGFAVLLTQCPDLRVATATVSITCPYVPAAVLGSLVTRLLDAAVPASGGDAAATAAGSEWAGSVLGSSELCELPAVARLLLPHLLLRLRTLLAGVGSAALEALQAAPTSAPDVPSSSSAKKSSKLERQRAEATTALLRLASALAELVPSSAPSEEQQLHAQVQSILQLSCIPAASSGVAGLAAPAISALAASVDRAARLCTLIDSLPESFLASRYFASQVEASPNAIAAAPLSLHPQALQLAGGLLAARAALSTLQPLLPAPAEVNSASTNGAVVDATSRIFAYSADTAAGLQVSPLAGSFILPAVSQALTLAALQGPAADTAAVMLAALLRSRIQRREKLHRSSKRKSGSGGGAAASSVSVADELLGELHSCLDEVTAPQGASPPTLDAAPSVHDLLLLHLRCRAALELTRQLCGADPAADASSPSPAPAAALRLAEECIRAVGALPPAAAAPEEASSDASAPALLHSRIDAAAAGLMVFAPEFAAKHKCLRIPARRCQALLGSAAAGQGGAVSAILQGVVSALDSAAGLPALGRNGYELLCRRFLTLDVMRLAVGAAPGASPEGTVLPQSLLRHLPVQVLAPLCEELAARLSSGGAGRLLPALAWMEHVITVAGEAFHSARRSAAEGGGGEEEGAPGGMEGVLAGGYGAGGPGPGGEEEGQAGVLGPGYLCADAAVPPTPASDNNAGHASLRHVSSALTGVIRRVLPLLVELLAPPVGGGLGLRGPAAAPVLELLRGCVSAPMVLRLRSDELAVMLHAFLPFVAHASSPGGLDLRAALPAPSSSSSSSSSSASSAAPSCPPSPAVTTHLYNLYNLASRLLLSLLKFQRDFSLACMPALSSGLCALMDCILSDVLRSGGGAEPCAGCAGRSTQGEGRGGCASCGCSPLSALPLLSRVFEQFARLVVVARYHAVTVLMQYLQLATVGRGRVVRGGQPLLQGGGGVVGVGLPERARHLLTPGLYALLDVLTQKELQQLHTGLAHRPAARAMLKSLHEAFTVEHKFAK